jgi:hypothetical protein
MASWVCCKGIIYVATLWVLASPLPCPLSGRVATLHPSLARGFGFIIVLIQLFKAKGAGHGVLGLFCGIYTFIWGWIESGRLNLKKTMMIWSLSFAASIVGNVMMGIAAASAAMNSPEIQKAVQQAQQAALQAQQAAQEAAQQAPVPANQ